MRKAIALALSLVLCGCTCGLAGCSTTEVAAEEQISGARFKLVDTDTDAVWSKEVGMSDDGEE